MRYRHGDLIGSTMLLTDEVGAAAAAGAYTAFGEWVSPGGTLPGLDGATRYRYAGAFGYESGLLALAGANAALGPITLQHLGARWYGPATGRFVQRDPIGIEGGLNVYAYCGNNPLTAVDPLGLWHWGRAAIGGITGAGTGLITGGPAGVVGGAIGGFIAGGTAVSDWEAFWRGGIAGIGGGLGARFVGGLIGAQAFGAGLGWAFGLGAVTCVASEAVHQCYSGKHDGQLLFGAGLFGGVLGVLGPGAGLLTNPALGPIVGGIGTAIAGLGGGVAQGLPQVFR